jgi:hypothetical protein
MAEDNDEWDVEHVDTELDRPEYPVVDDVPSGANDKEVTQAPIEDDLRRDPGVGAPEDQGERFLLTGHLGPPVGVLIRVGALALDEAPVAVEQLGEGVGCAESGICHICHPAIVAAGGASALPRDV